MLGAAFRPATLVSALLALVGSSVLRIIILVIFAAPAAIRGYALLHGVAHSAFDTVTALQLLCDSGGLVVGLASMLNIGGFSTGILLR